MERGIKQKGTKQIGFHASHELYSPRVLLDAVVLAEKCGFETISCSDHFKPWLPGGQSGFAFSWLGSALQATNISFSSVHAPGQRYHPAISAQAIATLSVMYPDRYVVGLGSGEALNELVTGEPWPVKSERTARLLSSARSMRRLLSGETVTVDEAGIKMHQAKLYSLPAEAPPLFAAAISPETAEWAGSWADGLITVSGTAEAVAQRIEAFRRGGGGGKPIFVHAGISYAEDISTALSAAKKNWPLAALKVGELAELKSPEEIEERVKSVSDEQIRRCFRISSDLEEHAQWIAQDFALGVDTVCLHYLGEDLPSFIRTFGSEVIPRVVREKTRE